MDLRIAYALFNPAGRYFTPLATSVGNHALSARATHAFDEAELFISEDDAIKTLDTVRGSMLMDAFGAFSVVPVLLRAFPHLEGDSDVAPATSPARVLWAESDPGEAGAWRSRDGATMSFKDASLFASRGAVRDPSRAIPVIAAPAISLGLAPVPDIASSAA